MVEKLLEEALLLTGNLLILMHIHLMVHLSAGSHSVVDVGLLLVVHRKRVWLRDWTHAAAVAFGVQQLGCFELVVITGSNRTSRSVHHLLVGMHILKGGLRFSELISFLFEVNHGCVLLHHLALERLHAHQSLSFELELTVLFDLSHLNLHLFNLFVLFHFIFGVCNNVGSSKMGFELLITLLNSS